MKSKRAWIREEELRILKETLNYLLSKVTSKKGRLKEFLIELMRK